MSSFCIDFLTTGTPKVNELIFVVNIRLLSIRRRANVTVTASARLQKVKNTEKKIL